MSCWRLEIGQNAQSHPLSELFSEPCLSAVPVQATNSDELDVLILQPRNTFLLWTFAYGTIPCHMSTQFNASMEKILSTSKRKRVSGDFNDEPRFVSPSRAIRIVRLKDVVHNRVNVALSNGSTYRISLDFHPRSSLVQRCIYAMKDCLDTSTQSQIVKRFWAFHYSSDTQLAHLKQTSEFYNFVAVLLSFSRFSCGTNNTMNNQTSWDHINQSLAMKKIMNGFPAILLDALEYEPADGSRIEMQKLLEASHNLRQDMENDFLLENEKLAVILESFHNVYESLKLNLLNKPCLEEMAELLSVLSSILGWTEYVIYYRFDGVPMIPILDVPQLDRTRIPFNFSAWIHNIVRQRSTADLPSNSEHANYYMKEIMDMGSFYSALYSKGPEAMLTEMCERGFKPSDFDHLPCGIALPLQEAIYYCKSHPPGDCSFEAYMLMSREDLAELTTGHRVPSLSVANLNEVDTHVV